jgi:hypothetical protein
MLILFLRQRTAVVVDLVCGRDDPTAEVVEMLESFMTRARADMGLAGPGEAVSTAPVTAFEAAPGHEMPPTVAATPPAAKKQTNKRHGPPSGPTAAAGSGKKKRASTAKVAP